MGGGRAHVQLMIEDLLTFFSRYVQRLDNITLKKSFKTTYCNYTYLPL